MRLAARIRKLEERAGFRDSECVDIVFVQGVCRGPDGHLQSKPCFAIFVGEDFGQFSAQDGETNTQFNARAQAHLEHLKQKNGVGI